MKTDKNKQNKDNKEQNKCLYEKLKRFCNQNDRMRFMPFD